MPARKKNRLQIGKPEKAEIVLLGLPLVALAVLVAFLAFTSKPAPAVASPTPFPQNAAVATPAASTPTTAVTTATATSVPSNTNSTTAAIATTIAVTNVATITTAPPATTVAASIDPVKTIVAGSPAGTGIKLSKTEGGLKFDMLVSPGHIGDNGYELVLSENGNQAVSDASLVRLSVTSLDMEMGVAQLDLTPAGPTQPGLYTGDDHKLQMLSMFGKYKVQVLVKRPARDDVTTSFDVSVTSS